MAIPFSPSGDHAVSPPAAGALFFAVWIVYLGDRLLDARAGGGKVPRTLRHAWAVRHLRLLAVLGAAAGAGLLLTLPQLGRDTVLAGIVPGIATGAYFAVFKWTRLHRFLPAALPAKELAIGFIFALGPVFARLGTAAFSELPLAAGLVAGQGLLFTGNCLLIGRAEAEADRDHDPSAYHAKPGSAFRLPAWVLGAALVAGAALPLPPQVRLSLVACASASLALALAAGKFPRDRVQASADGILLLPWLLPLLQPGGAAA